MIDTLMLVRLANSWRGQARNTQNSQAAETLELCANQLVSLVKGQAIDAVARPVKKAS